MKTIVSKIVKTEVPTNLEIEGATLLSVDEARKLPLRLKQHNNWWWLRSPGFYGSHVAHVYCDGSIDVLGSYANYDNTVCPALKITNLESSDLEIGDVFKFGDKEFEIISDTLAFCTTDIGKHKFDTYSNNYGRSEIKQYVDKWFNESICSYK